MILGELTRVYNADQAIGARAVSVCALAAILLAGCSARAAELSPPRPDSLRTEQLARGVTYEYHWYARGPLAVHSVTIDPRACGIEFRSVKGQDHVIGRETTSSMGKRAAERYQRPLLSAINADFFSFEPPGVSEGPQLSDAHLITSGSMHREALEDRTVRLRPVFALTRNRQPHITSTRLRGSVRTRALTFPLGGVNVRSLGNHTTVFTAAFGDATPVDTGALELVVRAGVVESVDTASAGVPIPRDGFVLAGTGGARAALAALAPGDSIGWTASFDSLPANVTEMVGGYPMLLRNDRAVHHDEPGLREAFSDRRHPRAAIGLDRRGRVHIIAVDGRRDDYSVGMTLQELSDYLSAQGITNALNFDGGGSTTLLVGDRIANRPSDAAGERPVANALVVLGPASGTCR